MNNPFRQLKNHYRGFARGQALAEMAGSLLVLVPLLIAGTDFGRLYYTNIEVVDAARAGAQYGSQSVITAADSAGMKTAARNDAANVPGLTASASQCTCMTSNNVAACPTAYCTNSPGATYVEVDTSTTFKTIVAYPGIPSTMTLAGKAVMMVED